MPLAVPSATHSWISGSLLDRVLPAVSLFDADAEDPANRPTAHHGPVFLRAMAVGPGRRQATPRLVVRELDVGELAGGFQIRRPIGDEPRVWDSRTAPVASQSFHNSVNRAVRHWTNSRRAAPAGVVAREVMTGCRLEVARAVLAEALAALRRPAIGKDPSPRGTS
jgi:hypothetical protein